MPLEAVIFDMDGLLIDSEPFWQAAEVEVFDKVGMPLTHAEAAQTVGMRLDHVVAYHYERHPWEGMSQQEVLTAILDRVIGLILSEGQAQEGVHQILEFLAAEPVRVGLATSSHVRLIDAVMERLGIRHYFEVICSAEFEAYGKPHPAVFLTAANALGVNPEKCLVLEDSMRGVIAAKAAQMKCICVPDPSLRNDPRLVLADKVLPSLAAFDKNLWQHLNQ